jgi:mRNA interferase MazF
MKRGDVVIVDFPFTSGSQSKVRPAVVFQNDRENRQLTKTIVARITGNLRRASEPTHLLIDPATPEGSSSNLHGKSLASGINLYTIDQSSVARTIGRLSATTIAKLNVCLRESLGLTSASSAASATP